MDGRLKGKKSSTFFKSYGFTLLLILSILIGSGLGILLKKDAALLKPLGDIFLNLLFTTLVPLVFFSIASAVAGMSNGRRLGKILSAMLAVFILTGTAASVLMVIGVSIYPPATGVHIELQSAGDIQQLKTSEQIVKAFTANDFNEILSKKNMLALILFSILVGLATSSLKERAGNCDFQASASDVMSESDFHLSCITRLWIMRPNFAYLTGVFGPDLLDPISGP
jgi:Na+/H+-dicarboxylate symporter